MAVVIGLAYAYLVFGWECLHFVVTSLVTWAGLRFLPRELRIGGVTFGSHLLIYAFDMLYLFVGHIDTVYNHYMQFALNWTAPQMMLTIKLTGTAFDLYDGTSKSNADQSEEQRTRALNAPPPLLPWLGYCFFFPTLLVGPPCGYVEYVMFTDRSLFKDEPNSMPPSPWSWAAVGRKAATGLLALSYHFLHARFPVSFSTRPEFMLMPMWRRLVYIIFTTELSFEHYYFGWSNAELACAVAGLAYNGRNADGTVKWDRCDMIDMWSLRTAQNGAVVGRAWNVLGARWLRLTVYTRLCDRNSSTVRKNAAQVATFLVSAFWHGFYPGFYFSFIAFAVANIASQMATRNVRPFFAEGGQLQALKPGYDFVTWFLTQACFYYSANPFKQMSTTNVLATWGSVYWIFHVGSLALILFYIVFGPVLRKFHPRRPATEVKPKAKRE